MENKCKSNDAVCDKTALPSDNKQPRVGVFGIGYDVYWKQFPGLDISC